MPVQFADPRKRAFETLLATDMVRLRNPETGLFLRCGAQGECAASGLTWPGHRYQADALRARAESEGRHWPYHTVRRDIAERGTIIEELQA